MACMCGGCITCLRDQGMLELPEFCPQCGVELEEDEIFCSDLCEREYVTEQKKIDDAMAKDIQECEQSAKDFWAAELG